MAKGSSYGSKSTEPSSTVSSINNIPRRATRFLREEPTEESVAATRVPQGQVGAASNKTTAPVTQEFATQYKEQPTRITGAKRTTNMMKTVTSSDGFSTQSETRTKATKFLNTPVVTRELQRQQRAEDSTRLIQTSHPLDRHRSWMKLLAVVSVGVVLGVTILVAAVMYIRGPVNPHYVSFTGGQTFPIQLGGSSDAFNLWNNSTGPIPSRTALPSNPGPYSVLGKPTITASFINEVLASYDSPTKGMGQSLYDLGVQYGIDPVYPLAFFMHESLFGTTGEARVTLSLGNERCIPDRACIDQDRGGYAQMTSWQDGFEHWYKLIRNLYIAQWGRVTVDQIIPKYAPNSDGNDEAAYISTLKHEVDTWRAGVVKP